MRLVPIQQLDDDDDEYEHKITTPPIDYEYKDTYKEMVLHDFLEGKIENIYEHLSNIYTRDQLGV